MQHLYLKNSLPSKHHRVRLALKNTRKRSLLPCFIVCFSLLTTNLTAHPKPEHKKLKSYRALNKNGTKTQRLYLPEKEKELPAPPPSFTPPAPAKSVAAEPDLKLTVAILTSAPYVDGGTITLRFTVQNAGTAYTYVSNAVPNVLPAGLEYISHNIAGSGGFTGNTWNPNWGNFSAGASYTMDVTARINATSDIVHPVTVSGGASDTDLSNNSATYTIPILSNSRPVVSNVTANNVMNNGSTVAITPLKATDSDGTISSYTLLTVPDSWKGTLYVNGAAATAGQKISPAQASQLSYKAATGQVGTHTFTYTAEDNLGSPAATAATYSIPVISGPDLAMTYQLLTPGPYSTGQQVVLRLKVTNQGTVSIPGATEVKNVLPNTLTYVSHTGTTYNATTNTWTPSQYNIDANTSATADFTVTIAGAVPLKQTVTVNPPSSVTDVDPGNNTVTYGVLNGTSVFDMATSLDKAAVGLQSIPALEGMSPIGTITSYTILALPGSTYGRLFVNGEPATANQVLSTTEASQLSFERAPLFKSGTTFFTYTATDNLGNSATKTATYRLNITPPEDESVKPLNVTLTDFKAETKNRTVFLTWHTATEKNNLYFEVERSTDAKKFRPIAKLPGAGNSNRLLTYIYQDAQAPAGTISYKLKQVDVDGKYEYSKTITVEVGPGDAQALVSLYPTQTNQSVMLDLTALPPYAYKVNIISAEGKLVRHLSAENKEINYVDVRGLKAGRYIVQVEGNNFTKTFTLVKE